MEQTEWQNDGKIRQEIDWNNQRLSDEQLRTRIAALSDEQKSVCRALFLGRPLFGVGNRLKTCAGLRAFSNIQVLELDRNKLTSCAELSALTNLKSLQLNHNLLTSCAGLSTLTNIRRLQLFYNRLTSCAELSALINLEELEVNANQLTSCAGLSTLANLRELSLQNNQLESCAGLETLTQLRVLNLSYNPISEVPYFLATFTKLTDLHLNNTPNLPILPKFKELLQRPEVREFQQYLRGLLEKGARILQTSLRVVVLGHTGVGKTTLLRNIMGAKHDSKATEGVEKHDWNGVQMWDFAGQEGYLCLHRMFIRGSRERTVFVILFDASSGDVARWSLKVREWLLTAFACSAQQRDEQTNAKLRVWFVGTRARNVSDLQRREARQALLKAVQDVRLLVGNDALEVEGEKDDRIDCFWVDMRTGVDAVKAKLEEKAQLGRDVLVQSDWVPVHQVVSEHRAVQISELSKDFPHCREALQEMTALGLAVYEEGLSMACSTEFAIDLVKCLFLGRMGRAEYWPNFASVFRTATPVWLERKGGGTRVWVKEQSKRDKDEFMLRDVDFSRIERESDRVLCVGGQHCFRFTDDAEMWAWQRPAGHTLNRDHLVDLFRVRVGQHVLEEQIKTFPLQVLKAHHLLLEAGSDEKFLSPLLFEQQEPSGLKFENPEDNFLGDPNLTGLGCSYRLLNSMTALGMDLVLTVFKSLQLSGQEKIRFWHNWELKEGVCGVNVEHKERSVFVFFRLKWLRVFCWGGDAVAIESSFRKALEVAELRMEQYGDTFRQDMLHNKLVIRKDPVVRAAAPFVPWFRDPAICVRCSHPHALIPRLCPDCHMVPSLFNGKVVVLRKASPDEHQRCRVFEGCHQERGACFVKLWRGDDERRWRREEAALRKLAERRINGVARLLEVDDFAIATDLIQGHNLFGVSNVDIRVFLVRMLSILASIHAAGVFHCDIHARNIMQAGGSFFLIDFDVSMSGADSPLKRDIGPDNWAGPYYPGKPMGSAVYDLMCLARTCEYLILNDDQYGGFNEEQQREDARKKLNNEHLWRLIDDMRKGLIANANDATRRLGPN